MKTIIDTLRYGWDVSRILRMLMGIAVLILGWVQHDNLMLLFGAWLILLPLFNLARCGAGGCDVNQSPPKQGSVIPGDKIKNFGEVK